MSRSCGAPSYAALLTAALVLVGCQVSGGNGSTATTAEPKTTTTQPDNVTVDETALVELGVNNLGVEIAVGDWLEATEELCLGEVLLADAADDFRAAHNLDQASPHEVTSALRDAAHTRCPTESFQ